jgi:hypothetical protein
MEPDSDIRFLGVVYLLWKLTTASLCLNICFHMGASNWSGRELDRQAGGRENGDILFDRIVWRVGRMWRYLAHGI